ncbi:MAG: DUF2788 domain-containing protein [Betaproteobacteria bacterium]
MQGTMFGFTEAQITEFGMTYGVGGLMLLMLFIVGHLAWESKAGKFGTFALFLGLTFGMVGYVAKYIIKYKLGIG